MRRWHALAPLAVTVGSLGSDGYATEYLTVEQAMQASFPQADRFQPMPSTLTKAQIQAIEKRSGVRVRSDRVLLTSAWNKQLLLGYFFVDQVLGKHEYITFSLALDAKLSVQLIEILSYRETYGSEIRRESWRAQFVDKTSSAQLTLDQDIRNISGATLSCRHITDGVKRLLVTAEELLDR